MAQEALRAAWEELHEDLKRQMQEVNDSKRKGTHKEAEQLTLSL